MLLGARLLPLSRRRQQLESALDTMLREDFAGRVLPFDSAAAAAYAAVVTARRNAGRPISHFDAQIAAVAPSRRAGLPTRDVSDCEECGLTLTNPWSAG